jgi:hypothetical protein
MDNKVLIILHPRTGRDGGVSQAGNGGINLESGNSGNGGQQLKILNMSGRGQLIGFAFVLIWR